MNAETWKAIFQWMADNVVLVIAVLSVFIEITPIKVTPIKSFIRWFGKYANAELTEKFEMEIKNLKESFDAQITQLNKTVDDLSSRVSQLETKQVENRMSEIRWTILQFSNDCISDKFHSKEEFNFVFAQYDEYKNLLGDTKDSVIEQANRDIHVIYDKFRGESKF